MKCPLCAGDSSVIQTYNNANNHVRRRRCCDSCGHRFTTKEKIIRAVTPGKKSTQTTTGNDNAEN